MRVIETGITSQPDTAMISMFVRKYPLSSVEIFLPDSGSSLKILRMDGLQSLCNQLHSGLNFLENQVGIFRMLFKIGVN